MVVLGGLGSITGAIVAAVILTLLNEKLRKLTNFDYSSFCLGTNLTLKISALSAFQSRGIRGYR